ncbi:MAG: flagellar motor protein MotA [Dongiaceae bacterium]
MTEPRRYLILMAIGVVAALVIAVLLIGPLSEAFAYNAPLNTGIFIVLAIGIVFIFWQVLRLYPEIAWIESFRRGQLTAAKPQLLGPMASMIGDRQGRLRLSAAALRSLLDGINSRLSESHDISRYLIALLVFLGLLGTFWGLLGTIRAVADAIGGISVAGGAEVSSLFDQLKQNLQSPLSGMGTAFSSSLFGLSGSLVLGFLELQAGQAQNRFYNELEDWLSAQTRLSAGGPIGDGEQPVPAYIQALLEQTAEGLENLQRTLSHTEDARSEAAAVTKSLADRLGLLADQMRTEQHLMVRIAENQAALQPVLTHLADLLGRGAFGLDDQSRQHLRSLDGLAQRLLDEATRGRQQTVGELRSEIKLLARTIAALAEGERQ